MKKSCLVAVAIFSVLMVLLSCARDSNLKPISYYENQMRQLDLADQQPQLISFKRTQEDIKGTYYLTYAPLFFSEPDEIRKARHKYLQSNIALELRFRKHGLVPIFDPLKFKYAKYEMNYSYHTHPGTGRTFSHSFDLGIFTANKHQEVWRGGVDIKKAFSIDISLYFDQFIMTIFKGFPEPQHTMKDFLDKLEK